MTISARASLAAALLCALAFASSSTAATAGRVVGHEGSSLMVQLSTAESGQPAPDAARWWTEPVAAVATSNATAPPAPALAVRLNGTDFAGATLDAAGLTGARWTSVKNLTLTGKIAGGFTCIQCSNLTLEGVRADGGITLVQGDHLTVHRADLTGAGVYAQRCMYLSVTETLFHDMTAPDFVNIPGCDEVDFEWNSLIGGKPPAGAHPDAIQGFRIVGFDPKHVVISHNFILVAGQGIFGVAGLTAESNLIRIPYQNAAYPDGPSTLGGNVIASQPDGFAQATIIISGGPITFSAPNLIGAWKTKPAFTIGAPPAAAKPNP